MVMEHSFASPDGNDTPSFTSDEESIASRRDQADLNGTSMNTTIDRYDDNPYLTDVAVHGESALSRPRSPSILSESTKPDPPSVVDGNSIQDQDEQLDENDMEETPRGTDCSGLSDLSKSDGGHINHDKILEESQYLSSSQLSQFDRAHSSETMSDLHCADVLATLSGTPLTDEQVCIYEDSPEKQVDPKSSEKKYDTISSSIAVEETNTDAPSIAEEELTVTSYASERRPIALIYDAPSDNSSALAKSQTPSVDGVEHIPRVDEHTKILDRVSENGFSPQRNHPLLQLHPMQQHQSSFGYPPMSASVMMNGRGNGGRRRIRLKLEEDVHVPLKRARAGSFLGHIRSRSKRMFGSDSNLPSIDELEYHSMDRGTITVSWFEGTSGIELYEHVRKCVVRKLRLPTHTQLTDMRVLDESSSPPEEIVLSPYIPDGSEFLLQFSTKDKNDGTSTPGSMYSIIRAPESPSAAPSPHPRQELAGLSSGQLEKLRNQLNALRLTPGKQGTQNKKRSSSAHILPPLNQNSDIVSNEQFSGTVDESNEKGTKDAQSLQTEQKPAGIGEKTTSEEDLTDDSDDDMMLHSDDPIEAQLRQITKLLITDRQKSKRNSTRHGKEEKRQVIFVLANYFVLFLSLIAISAEIQARLPDWLVSMETHMKNVQDCAADQEALFQCVSNGDFAGLIASVLVWLSRSVVTKRIFLLGYDTPKKLWTVVYESMVTAVCWGFSYIFIRRGMNPDTRPRFIQKYWKDAVYGSLAGFNAAFMKQILKNLIPQEAVEDALRDRQLKILSWLPNFA
jgi:ABC-type Na+ efflux pump permease subunit